jgi:hypothetical protein
MVALSLGLKRPGREADHSPPNIAEVKKKGFIYPLLHTPSWLSVYFVQYRNNFTFISLNNYITRIETSHKSSIVAEVVTCK